MARIKITRAGAGLYEGKTLSVGDVIDPNPARYGAYLVRVGVAEFVPDEPVKPEPKPKPDAVKKAATPAARRSKATADPKEVR